jgi:NADH:ubiquinone reductase (H+-translocating)
MHTEIRASRRRGRARAAPDAPRVVVIGAGFAGLSALHRLGRLPVRATLVDRNAYSTFQPLLYQVATAGLTSSDVAYPLWTAARKARARFHKGELAGIDVAARQALLADGVKLEYDYLILATGITAAFYGVPGAAEHALSLYTRRDAIVLRNRLMSELESRSGNGSDRGLSVTIVGGGATGVELAGTVAELRNIALPVAFPDIDQARVQVRLIEMGPVLIAPFRARLREYARGQLAARGVDIRVSTEIKQVLPDRVLLGDGSELPSDLTVWAAGVAAPQSAAGLGLAQGAHGRIRTGPDLRVVGQERIFAVGDLGLIDSDPVAQLAQPAIQQGRHAADQVRRLLAGQPTQPFRYHDKGTMATIGHRSAVVELAGPLAVLEPLLARGTLAWLSWLALHLVTLLGGRNRVSALVNLSWRYLTWSRGGGLIVGDDVPPPADPAGKA